MKRREIINEDDLALAAFEATEAVLDDEKACSESSRRSAAKGTKRRVFEALTECGRLASRQQGTPDKISAHSVP